MTAERMATGGLRSRLAGVLGASALVLLGTSVVSSAGIERFQSEYPAAARRLESALGESRGTCRIVQVERGRGAGKRLRYEGGFLAAEGCWRLDFTQAPGRGGPTGKVVYCQRPDSSFAVIQRAEGRPYEVLDFAVPEVDEAHDPWTRQFGRFFKAPYAFNGLPMTEILRDPTFQAISAEEVAAESGQRYRLRFRFGKSMTPARYFIATFCPDRCWAITDAAVYREDQADPLILMSVEYDPRDQGVPMPRRVSYRTPVETNPVVCDFTSFDRGTTPKHEFSLTRFGLREMPLAPSNTRNDGPALWLLGLSLTGFLAVLGLRRLARRLSY